MQKLEIVKVPLNIQILSYAYVSHKYAQHRFEHISICRSCGSEYQVKIREDEDGPTQICQNCGRLNLPIRRNAA